MVRSAWEVVSVGGIGAQRVRFAYCKSFVFRLMATIVTFKSQSLTTIRAMRPVPLGRGLLRTNALRLHTRRLLCQQGDFLIGIEIEIRCKI